MSFFSSCCSCNIRSSSCSSIFSLCYSLTSSLDIVKGLSLLSFSYTFLHRDPPLTSAPHLTPFCPGEWLAEDAHTPPLHNPWCRPLRLRSLGTLPPALDNTEAFVQLCQAIVCLVDPDIYSSRIPSTRILVALLYLSLDSTLVSARRYLGFALEPISTRADAKPLASLDQHARPTRPRRRCLFGRRQCPGHRHRYHGHDQPRRAHPRHCHQPILLLPTHLGQRHR